MKLISMQRKDLITHGGLLRCRNVSEAHDPAVLDTTEVGARTPGMPEYLLFPARGNPA